MGGASVMVPIALVAYLVCVGACFAVMEPRRAMIATLLGGWLFLPHYDGRYTFLQMHDKAMYVPTVVLAWSVLFDAGRWLRLRPRPLDLLALVLCAVPFATALSNDLGTKEALAATFEATTTWGSPYLLGRVYLGSEGAAAAFARALVVAALVYTPFCLWEIRMSPQLQYTIYGFRAAGFSTALRFGGYRPEVFMQAGLAVGMFMAVGTLCAAWLWRSRAVADVAGVPMVWITAGLAATTVLCKSTGAVLLLGCGLGVLEGTRRLRTATLVLALALLPAAYGAARMAGWTAGAVTELTRVAINEERAASLAYRIRNEDMLIAKAVQRPWLGWGRTGRSFVYDAEGRSVGAVVDGLWIIALGFTGLVGLLALGALLALPPLALLRAAPARLWGHPAVAPAAALAVALLLWAVDSVLNAMTAPIFPAIAGGLTTLVAAARQRRRRPLRRARRAAPPPPGVERPAPVRSVT